MRDRIRDYALLLAVSALLTLPNLGAISLYDVDEGVNAEAAREMRESNTWVIPTFNYQLRTAKPVMQYWLERFSFAAFGVSEWSARLPSALGGWLVVLLVYELARRMFGRGTGLLSGLILVSVGQFAVLSHAATPDATLLLFTMLTYFVFWRGHLGDSRRWWVPTAAACGLAVLTKGPIGVGLPGLVLLLYFAWNRELGRLLDRKIFLAGFVFILVIGPWYGLVANETRGEWLTAFLGNENVNRFLAPMERHDGGVWFYPVVVFVMFFPWSAFLLAAIWYGAKGALRPNPPTPFPEKEGGESTEPGLSPSPLGRGVGVGSLTDSVRAHRFLICWAASYLVFFSAAATKLPNYVFPLYPALAILTARFLIAWREGELTVPRWLMPAGVAGVCVLGIAVTGAMLYAERLFPGLGVWAVVGLIPLAGGIAMSRYLRQGDRNGVVTAMAASSVAFIGLLVAFPPTVVDRQRAPRELVRATGLNDPTREARIATFEWYQPSVVFYTGREVARLNSPDLLVEFFAIPTPAYAFVPAPSWEKVKGRIATPHRVIARHNDFLRESDILVITNTPSGDVAGR